MVKYIYSRLQKKLGGKSQGKLSKLVFTFTNKPVVKKDGIYTSKKFPNGEKGGLIISADFEMAWAWRYTKTGADHISKGKSERENLPRILDILDKNKIPITFATVGHLFLAECKKGDHEWMKRIPYFDDHWKFNSGDWYDHDPYSNYKDAPEWYAADLIDMIINSKVDHEIGSHTFSHIDFSYNNCPSDVAEDEIKACIRAAQDFKIDIKSMVFPGGTWGNIEVLNKYGFSIYRKREKYELAYPYRDKFGLLVSVSTGSLEYNLKFGWEPEYFVRRLIKYIDKAIETNTIAHLWFHPSLNPFILENIFPTFLKYCSDRRDSGELWIGTMNQIATHINENGLL